MNDEIVSTNVILGSKILFIIDSVGFGIFQLSDN